MVMLYQMIGKKTKMMEVDDGLERIAKRKQTFEEGKEMRRRGDDELEDEEEVVAEELKDADADDVVAPARDVAALAAYLERHSIDDASVRLHLYPCGGVERCLAYVEGLCSGNNS